MTDHEIQLEHPTPDPAWRGALGRRLGSVDAPPARPRRLGVWIGGLATAGAMLLLAALTQI
jgi:hypothetical protein